MKERQILQDSIRDHQKAIDKAEKELAKLETTYSIGDRFRIKGRDVKAMLARNGDGKVVIVDLGNGGFWGYNARAVENETKVTPQELSALCDAFTFIRYWDSRKKVHCD